MHSFSQRGHWLIALWGNREKQKPRRVTTGACVHGAFTPVVDGTNLCNDSWRTGGEFMATKEIFNGPIKCILIAISSITLAGCSDADGGTASKAITDKALRKSKSAEKAEKSIPVPDSGHTLVLMAFAAGVVFMRIARRT